MDVLDDPLSSGADIAIDVARGHVDEDKADELSVLAANAGRAGFVIDVRQKFDGNLRSAWCWNENTLDRAEILPEVARVSRIYGVTLAPFDSSCDCLAADGRFDYIVHVLNREAIAGSRFAVDGEIEEVASGRALGKNGAGVVKPGQGALNLHRRILNPPEIGAENLDS